MIGRIYLGRYEAQKLLGEGGMGQVFLAKQLDLGRSVVVKVMHEHVAQDAKFRDRFQRETLVMARFQHPNAVTLYDASLTDPFGPCIVMEYVKGENLETLLKKNGKLSAGRVARTLSQLCEVLQAAHDEGIIHRDLKPANIMIVDPDTPKERVKVMDFGLAKLVDDGRDRRVTDTTIDFAVGTPGYICPEQVRGEAMDHRGDLYSVGVMLFELLTGQLPFKGANSMDVLLAHATEDPPSFASLGLAGVVPPGIEEVVRAVLAKEPEGRPQSAKELFERYQAALGMGGSSSGSGQPEGPVLETPPEQDAETVMLVATAPELLPPRPGQLPIVPPRAVVKPKAEPPVKCDALSFNMEAYMPESIAVMKLRGFAHDSGGQILESVPGMVKLKIGARANSNGALSWFGLSKKSDGPVELELQLTKPEKSRAGHLLINVLFKPSHASLMADDAWQKRCSKLFIQLRSYLIG
jgi:serine/threonine-protein kinase